MMKDLLPPLPSLRQVVDDYHLWPDKAHGQNFLFDQNLTDKIARNASVGSNDIIVEIGPGPGGLTRSLLRAGAQHVFAIEKDPRCLAPLKELSNYYPNRLSLIEGDALTVSLTDICVENFKIVANLPYHISTRLLCNWLENDRLRKQCQKMTLLFQKEVTERIAAKEGTAQYGRLAILAQNLCLVEAQFTIHPHAFFPAPNVVSQLVSLTPYEIPRLKSPLSLLSKLTHLLFQQRRKMLRATLRPLDCRIEELLVSIAIDPTRRAETLSIEEIDHLCIMLNQRGLL
jgi:16S rRNA (adenine1518-N6/adenine1519-N6)-dimethyltransferase